MPRLLPALLSTLALTVLPAPALAAERVVVQFAPGTSQAAQTAAVERAGGRVTDVLPVVGGVGAEIDAGRIEALASAPGVAHVTSDDPMVPAGQCAGRWDEWCPAALTTSFPSSARLDRAWTDPVRDATGAGVGIAIVDTGVAGDLPEFRVADDDATSRVRASVVVHPDARTAGDRYGHGTHVAGIAAANGRALPASDPLQGHHLGAAPRADVISVKVSDDEGRTSTLDVLRGLQFVVDHRTALGIRVVNLSLTSTVARSHLVDPLDAAVESAWRQGLVVVAAAGNRGTAADAVHYAPGNSPYAITVGAVDDRGTPAPGDDVLASWSSRGTTQDGAAKPDVLAPGVGIVAPLAPGSAYAQLCPSCVRDGGRTFRVSGTSMATPIVSGAAAVLLSSRPELTPDQVKGILAASARTTADGARALGADLALSTPASLAAGTNAGLASNELVDPATGAIDWTKASWAKASWATAGELLKASWAKASWACADCAPASSEAVDDTKASWAKASWAKASWASFLGVDPAAEVRGGELSAP